MDESRSPYSGPSVPRVPSSSAEVTIRTMASDTESLGKGGGALPTGERVSLKTDKANVTAQQSTPLPSFGTSSSSGSGSIGGQPVGTVVAETAEAPRSKKLLIILLAIGIPVLFLVGFFLLPSLFVQPTAPPAQKPVATLPTPAQPTSTAPAAPSARFFHNSFFSVKPDASFPVQLSGTSTVGAALAFAMKTAAPTSTFVEPLMQDQNGNALALSDFLSAVGASTLDPQFVSSTFSVDPTVFVYREQKNFYPGIILKLLPGKIPVVVQPSIQLKIEGAPGGFANLFAISPGEPSGSFKSDQIVGDPDLVRVVNFSASSTVLIYGWYKNNAYLMIATSKAAVAAAMARL